ncbi:GIY-YIG nuclease family protein [Paratissierella segnis]|jgi:putative endonuclease|uniref:GIY-YIG nuclease family protein n=1 Tax=Paratissierella segnis TaxID=2763679 RepID=A0A926ETS2_9FIRM|nr:GIY-YIG nuclease family protein [Paratissierella segnis]MBC8588746.1 GIY-YIG nuclease family protein [Paratissierella segnis]
MYYVYIVKCSDNTLYTGYTIDIEKRLENHNSGTGAKYTRGRTPVELVYLEKYNTKGEALRREAFIKSLPRKKKFKLIESE